MHRLGQIGLLKSVGPAFLGISPYLAGLPFHFMNVDMTHRVLVSPEARAVIKELKKRFGELMFHQSGGCCDGSQPMCFEKGDFKVGTSDVCLGDVAGCEFWMSKDQFEYWKHTQLTLHIVEGRGSSFSLEIPMGKRFVIKSRIFTEKEMEELAPLQFAES